MVQCMLIRIWIIFLNSIYSPSKVLIKRFLCNNSFKIKYDEDTGYSFFCGTGFINSETESKVCGYLWNYMFVFIYSFILFLGFLYRPAPSVLRRRIFSYCNFVFSGSITEKVNYTPKTMNGNIIVNAFKTSIPKDFNIFSILAISFICIG